jgi:hypothetical protein
MRINPFGSALRDIGVRYAASNKSRRERLPPG